MNNVNLIGRWAKDNELRYGASGTAILKNAIAVNRPFSKEKEVDFIDVTIFGKIAENTAKFTEKGSLVGLGGRIQQEKWETQNGDKRQRLVVIGTEVEFLEFKNKDNQQSNQQSNSNVDTNYEGFQPVDDDSDLDDVPF